MHSHASLPPSSPQHAIPTRRISQPQPSMVQPAVNMQTTPQPPPLSPLTRSEPSTRPSLARSQSHTSSTHSPAPVTRSQWAMWVGNVPADATNEELSLFFNQPHRNTPSDNRETSPSTLSPISGGVTSVFLIGRSNCAFVNFESQSQLESAATTFNGRRLREGDSRGPRLVCRVRKQDDDDHAGVNGQRQSNIHVKWLRERQLRTDETTAAVAGNSSKPALPISRPVTVDDIATQLRFLSSRAVDVDARKQGNVLSEDSFGSTTSSLLSRHFPRRFFILKSLSQVSFAKYQSIFTSILISVFFPPSDLDESVRTGFWTTQPHNEDILNRAYRTSHSVYIIFGVNKSGEFYGYARMAGPIGSASLLSSQPIIDGAAPEQTAQTTNLLPTARFRAESPEVVDEEEHSDQDNARSHPGDTSQPPSYMSIMSAPPQLGPPRQQGPSADAHPVTDWAPTLIPAVNLEGITESIREPGEEADEVSPSTEAKALGTPFMVEWVRTDRLPFLRTRHLRNPWNHGRQVKVSRDGTELEPDVACQLLEEWDRPPPPAPSTQNTPSRTKPHAPSQRRRSKASAGPTSPTSPS
ncbi:uncharacterized protein STEHIDRAFT_144161 [Stereum hirsutum FP-91666 SS1]|uniref:uncharacterized protein n=1 Tax=Stereum hirsutum (strain FP-91666) TaxID=721885 RepID=UPI0004410296|nr:uncharacterized protein STEHIDRAFT_144161 [Stereum hirsutum FP-91666 SS1]EIM92915.1 hypothetical protein STEHIDRAFT_144161 [Stereum hirsutum FP-91666 SS1]